MKKILQQRRIMSKAGKKSKAKSSGGHKYSIIMPTYNERENLPLITQLIDSALSPKLRIQSIP